MTSSQRERYDGLTQRLASAEAATAVKAHSSSGVPTIVGISQRDGIDALAQGRTSAEAASSLTPAQAARLQGLLKRLAASELAVGVGNGSASSSLSFTPEQIARIQVCKARMRLIFALLVCL